jgi:protein TonB
MFDQTFVNGVDQTKKPAAVAFSLSMQVAVICLLVLLPLVYTQALPSAQLKNLLVAPLPRQTAVTQAVPHRQTRPAFHVFVAPRLIAPERIPTRINSMADAPSAPEIGLPTGEPSANAPLIGFPTSVGEAPLPPPPAKPPKAAGPVAIGGKVAAANVIYSVRPAYPPLAKSARVQGTVEFTAVISKRGTIEKLTLVRGHPLLVNAAREAVSQWRYRPTLLNGQPVQVITDIIVNFTLSP